MPTSLFFILLISLTTAASASSIREKLDNSFMLLIGDVLDGLFGTYLNVFTAVTQAFVVPLVGTGIFNYIG